MSYHATKYYRGFQIFVLNYCFKKKNLNFFYLVVNPIPAPQSEVSFALNLNTNRIFMVPV